MSKNLNEVDERPLSKAVLTQEVIEGIVRSRGRSEGSLWVFDPLGVSLLVNDVANALLAAPAADSQAEVAQGMTEAEIRESNAVLDQVLSDFYAATAPDSQAERATGVQEERGEVKCTKCNGFGYYRGKWPYDWSVICEDCNGTGRARAASTSIGVQDERGAALTDADLSDLYSFAKGKPRPEWIDHAREFIAARAKDSK